VQRGSTRRNGLPATRWPKLTTEFLGAGLFFEPLGEGPARESSRSGALAAISRGLIARNIGPRRASHNPPFHPGRAAKRAIVHF
jgi:hypothetical protein